MATPVTVIIADDESAIRNGLNEIVSSLDVNAQVVGSADNGVSALSLLREFQPDIAIMDISMPDMSGLEVIRRAYEEKLSTYFLILSGYGDFEYAREAITYGVKSYFLKPLNLVEFREVFSQQCSEIRKIRDNSDLISNHNISTLVDSSRTLLLNQLLQKRFYKAEDIINKLKMLRLSIRNTKSCTVLFSLCSTDMDIPPAEAVQDVLPRLFDGYLCESWVYTDNQIVSIMNIEEAPGEAFRSRVREGIDLLTRAGCPVKAGIGTVIEHLGMAYASYSGALEALSYRIYDTEAMVFDEHSISTDRPSFSSDNIDYKPLIYAITHQSLEQITDYCDSFFDSMFAGRTPPPNYVIGMCMYLIVNLQKQLELLYPVVLLDMDMSYEKFYHFDSIRQLRLWVTDVLTDYSRLLTVTDTDKNGIIRMAREFIQKSLDKNIKARDVAEQVHLSESYFTIYFKNKTGTNFRDYLLNERMTLARKLLVSGECNISEIAFRVGYQDYRSFSRAFKNAAGMSPSDYLKQPET